MRTETVTIPEHTVTTTYYNYDELNDDAKSAVKQWFTENYRWSEDFSECVENDLENLFGVNCLNVEYSLSYSQGDGLNIYGKIDAKKILDFMGSDVAGEMSMKYADVLSDEEKNVIRGYCDYDCGYYHDYGKIFIPQNRHSYFNCLADDIDIAEDWAGELETYDVDVDIELLRKFESAVIDLFTDICKTYEKWGYEFFYEIGDDEMSDICDCNEWEFSEDGEILS